jgi:hypothetical protein
MPSSRAAARAVSNAVPFEMVTISSITRVEDRRNITRRTKSEHCSCRRIWDEGRADPARRVRLRMLLMPAARAGMFGHNVTPEAA